MAGDANFASVSLLLHGDGANNATTTTDSSGSPKTINFYGGAKISTAESKFGGSSLYFDGVVGSRIEVPSGELSDPGLVIGMGDFVAEGHYFMLEGGPLDSGTAWVVGAYGTSYGVYGSAGVNGANAIIWFGRLDPYANTICSYSTPKANLAGGWHHIAWVRRSGIGYIFLDGVQVASGANSTNVSAPVRLRVGCMNHYTGVDNFSVNYTFNGYIDDFRLTVGVARYSTTFTPPGAPHPDQGYVLSGVIRDDTGAPCARTVRAYDRATGVLLSSTTSNVSTGAYTLNVGDAEVQRIVLDDSGGSLYNDIIDRVLPA